MSTPADSSTLIIALSVGIGAGLCVCLTFTFAWWMMRTHDETRKRSEGKRGPKRGDNSSGGRSGRVTPKDRPVSPRSRRRSRQLNTHEQHRVQQAIAQGGAVLPISETPSYPQFPVSPRPQANTPTFSGGTFSGGTFSGTMSSFSNSGGTVSSFPSQNPPFGGTFSPRSATLQTPSNQYAQVPHRPTLPVETGASTLEEPASATWQAPSSATWQEPANATWQAADPGDRHSRHLRMNTSPPTIAVQPGIATQMPANPQEESESEDWESESE